MVDAKDPVPPALPAITTASCVDAASDRMALAARKVCAAVKVLEALNTAMFAPAKVLEPVPPLAIATIPDTLVAFPLRVAVIVPALKLPEASRATMVLAVFALVALEVTVKVWADAPLNVAEPDRPVPEVASVRLFDTCVAVVAVDAFPLNAAVMVPALKLPEASRATMVDAVLALVALEVTVNVEFPDWLAVNEALPDKPVPDTAIVNVPLLTVAGVVQLGAAAPLDVKT